MTMKLAIPAVLAVLVSAGHGQEMAPAPAFEVASVTPCAPGTPGPSGEHSGMVQLTFPGGKFMARALTATFLLEWAYGIQPSQHSSGPPWMTVERYDIIAKASGNAGDAEMKLMLRTLLAERFHLQIHHETKVAAALVLTLGKTAPKLYPPKPEEVHSIRILPKTGDGEKVVSYHVVATRFSIGQLMDTFARQMGSVIVNRTGLEGDYDFTLDMTPDENQPNPLDPGHILNALREQLGLVVKTEKVPVDYLVIDGAERVAREN
jgi:uncharacterized protein (TIGR03435 family)